MVNNRPIRYIIYGQLGFLISLAVCILLLPNGLAANDGISYYGVHARTVIPYSAGLLVLGWFYLKLAQSLPRVSRAKPIVYVAYCLLPLFAVATVTPYKHSSGFHWAHVAITIVIFAVQILLAMWLVIMVRWDMANVLLIFILVVEGLIAVIYVRPANGFLIQTESSFQLTFAILLIRSVSILPRNITEANIITGPIIT